MAIAGGGGPVNLVTLGLPVVHQQNPNLTVWRSATGYLEAAEILLDYSRIWPAAILAAFSIELYLKCFLAERIANGVATTQRGHSLVGLFAKLSAEDREAILAISKQIDRSVQFQDCVDKFDQVFENGRYMHEPNAEKSMRSDIIYFSRHCHSTVFVVAKQRNV